MFLRRTLLVVPLLLLSAFGVADADPNEPPSASKAEARERFDAGLRYFNDGDNAAALAEFKRTYELIANPIVLYNIGLVYAVMNRSVEAVDTLDLVLKDPSVLSPERLARARKLRDEHARRVATLTIRTNVPDASIAIDNIDVGKAQAGSLTVRVTSGTHVVGAVAAGNAPLRKEVTIAGEAKEDLELDLVAIEGKLAHLTLKTRLPGADVVIDDEAIGKTPLAQSITLVPGRHVIELRRPGYLPARQEMTLGDGAVAGVTLDPLEDREAIDRDGGFFTLDASEGQAVATIDGQVRQSPIRLAPGEHHLTVERAGFFTIDREFEIQSHLTTSVHAQLLPTPETRAEVASRAGAYRTWAWIATLGGAAIAGSGAVVLIANAGPKSRAQSAFDQANGALQAGTGICDIPDGGSATQCNANATAAQSKLSAARSRDVAGGVLIASGVAVTGVGVALFLFGPDAHKYDRPSTEPAFAITPRAWLSAGSGGIGVEGRY